MVCDDLPLLPGHLEWVWSFDPEGLWLAHLLIVGDKQIVFPGHVDKDSIEDGCYSQSLADAGPTFGMSDCSLLENDPQYCQLYLSPH